MQLLDFLTNFIPTTKASPSYYFAYGSNMLRERLEERVEKVDYIGRAVLSDYAVSFSKLGSDGSGKATIVKRDGEIVEGAIFSLTENQLRMLDRFEGYPKHYIREELVVFQEEDQRSFKATTYIACLDHVKEGLLPTKEYLDFILQGAQQINARRTYSKFENSGTLLK